jgi:hypothetical protein
LWKRKKTGRAQAFAEAPKEEDFMSADNQPARPSNKMLWAGRIISALPVLLLLFSGTMKLLQPPDIVTSFKELGYDEDLIRPIGIAEVCCALLYAVPQTCVLGAILVTGYLGGATATHLRLHQPMFVGPVIFGILAWIGVWLRDSRLRALAPWRRL